MLVCIYKSKEKLDNIIMESDIYCDWFVTMWKNHLGNYFDVWVWDNVDVMWFSVFKWGKPHRGISTWINFRTLKAFCNCSLQNIAIATAIFVIIKKNSNVLSIIDLCWLFHNFFILFLWCVLFPKNRLTQFDSIICLSASNPAVCSPYCFCIYWKLHF